MLNLKKGIKVSHKVTKQKHSTLKNNEFSKMWGKDKIIKL